MNSRLTFALVLTTAFALVLGVGLQHHEIWLDEAQAWLIGGRADSLRDVFHGLRYEGHPPLWYLAIFAVSRVWASPVAMQVLSLLFISGAVFLVAWKSPFSRLQATLFAFGYFPLFEWGMVSRGYGLGLFCLAAYAAMRFAGVRTVPLLVLPLTLAALTSVYGLILAWALGLSLAISLLLPDPADNLDIRPFPIAFGAGLLLLGTACAVFTMLPPRDAAIALLSGDTARAAWALFAPFWGFLPLPDPSSLQPWSSSLFAGRPFLGELAYTGGGLMLVATTFVFAGRIAAQIAYLAGSSVLILFAWHVYAGGLRHHGHFLMLWLLCMWVARPSGPQIAATVTSWQSNLEVIVEKITEPALALGFGIALIMAAANALAPWSAYLLIITLLGGAAVAATNRFPTLRRAARSTTIFLPGGRGLTALLGLHALLGLWFWSLDYQRPFSATAALARTIDDMAPIYVLDGTQSNLVGPPLAALIGRDVIYISPASMHAGSYLIWNHDRPAYTGEPTTAQRRAAVIPLLARLAREKPARTPAWLVSEIPIEAPSGLSLKLVVTGPVPLVGAEPVPLCLYRLERVFGAGESRKEP